MEGFICLNKPSGITSHDAVNRLRKILKTKKIGHTGTLDPLATGVLVMCVGSCAKLADYIQSGTKSYICRMKIGLGTDSLDIDGNITASVPAGHICADHIKGVLHSFRGEILQVPPMVSAVKKNGVPLYKLARQGKEVDIESRVVAVSELELLDWYSDAYQPSCLLKITCSKGTYIRSLVRDFGRCLGTPCVVEALHRSQNAGFEDTDSVTLEELEGLLPEEIEKRYLQPMSLICRYLPYFDIVETQKLVYGQFIKADAADSDKVIAMCGDTVAALGYVKDRIFYPKKVFVR